MQKLGSEILDLGRQLWNPIELVEEGFLKTAALAGLGAGAGWSARELSASGQAAAADAKDAHDPGEHLRRGILPRRGTRMSVDHITFYTPLQDYGGIITPSHLHFVQQHSSHFPEIDAEQHRLTIHGLVDRPLSFSMDDLKRLPSVPGSFPGVPGKQLWPDPSSGQSEHGVAVQFIWG